MTENHFEDPDIQEIIQNECWICVTYLLVPSSSLHKHRTAVREITVISKPVLASISIRKRKKEQVTTMCV
jgi:hypothetical protein